MPVENLYIGEPNTIYLEIEDVTDAEVMFTITPANITDHDDVAGAAVGTADVAMNHNPAFVLDEGLPTERTIAAYVGTLTDADASELAPATSEEPNYIVWIDAPDYTLRRLPRVAVYRGSK